MARASEADTLAIQLFSYLTPPYMGAASLVSERDASENGVVVSALWICSAVARDEHR